MAEAEAVDGVEDGKKKVGGKKLVLFIVLPLLILAGAGVGVYMSGLLDPLIGGDQAMEADGEAEEEEAEPLVATPGAYLEVPEMLVSLRSSGRKQQVLKLQINLELESAEDLATIEGFMPKIRDNFQVFLRELRVEELEGSQGIYRVKEEMLARVNEAAHPMKVRDVLISEFIIQ
ncbi:MAG: flagellar basal body-associated FliL family protein [Alphaproteobacteria bacterium]|nr:flagellar basal body-associated FliL family protein [Alphaproteobacteria bacterium]